MGSPDRKLILDLASKILELQYRSEALASILRTRLGVTPEELHATVEAHRAVREAALKEATRTQEETLLNLLEGFQGPEQ